MKNVVIIYWAINQIIELMTTFINEQIIQISFANQIQLFQTDSFKRSDSEDWFIHLWLGKIRKIISWTITKVLSA